VYSRRESVIACKGQCVYACAADGMCILDVRAVLCGGRSVEMPHWDEHKLDANLKHIREELSLPMEVFMSQPLPLREALLNFHFTHTTHSRLNTCADV
jgi:hypothetical protein